jgi:four helix bundle protein
MPTNPPDYRARTFAFACDIVRLYQALVPIIPAVMARQILRSGTSIGANLEEAKPAQSRKDLISKFTIALKEARETSYWLRLVAATSLAPKPLLERPLAEANELVAILTTSVRRLKERQPPKGT